MLTAVRLKDFKNHVDTQIPLGRLTCLVGPNGCGKTSVLEGIAFACTSLAEGAVSFFRRSYVHEDFIRQGCQSFTVETKAEKADPEERYLIAKLALVVSLGKPLTTGRGSAPDEFSVRVQWRTNCADAGQTGVVSSSGDVAPTSGDDEVTRHGLYLPPRYKDLKQSALLLSPVIPQLRVPSYSPDETPAMSPDGATLASVIAYLITADPDRFVVLLARIREVIPAVQRLRVRPAKVELIEPTKITVNRKEIPYAETREVIGHELLFDLKGAPGVPARAVSEGTLLVTALLTATVWNQGADVLLIDDLEKGLHPKAQRELVMALKALLDTDPKLQIAFSTHSPYVVDELSADQVCILVPDEQRGVVARRLSDHPRAADALQVLTTGEFLSAEGEDWVREFQDAA